MDYGRMSTARSSGNNNRSRQPDEGDAFMTLPDKEIAGCINDITGSFGMSFTLADLHKPNPQQIQKIFEMLLDVIMNVTREVVAPAMRAAAEDMCGPDAERIYTSDTRDLMAFFLTTRKLLAECGIHDFTFQDLYKPTRERLAKIFSYLINFIRFRESQSAVIDEHWDKAQTVKNRIETLHRDNKLREVQLADLQRNRKGTETAVQQREKRNSELKQRLLDLKRAQERVQERLERVKEEQNNLKRVLEEKTEATMNVKQEAAKLRPYTQQSPAVLEDSLRDLNASLTADKTQIDSLDRRARALQTSTDSFGVVISDVHACTRLLTDVQTDLSKEEEELTKAARHRDALSDRSNNVRDVERQERLLQKQLSNVNARTDKLRRNADEKAETARTRMEELKSVHKRLAEERGEKGKEMERRRVRIEQTEKKMADLKENIENEVHAAHDEYLKMESHIKLYITEMESSL
ncbi:uncharacterized protein BDZ99DRAFT_505822 [Mytilinidion resinicola]|uniref:Probable kinetochore protein NUF2 n=1 Tax=Mytilinidion resinicola TaxID=574789 RepID=A0A6A6Z6D8_9PEZI|nr:uncharacterized protein BDZ99DRAFT_505822 [Mytilinidion resinicola]KAF2816378.1 hypothetical protein BDZ99DRAFT_505822 [Mytilinidion resinicola]